MFQSRRRRRTDPIWLAPVLIVVLLSIVALTWFVFNGTFRSYLAVTLVSDRAGLVMEPRAAVKLHGVQVGEVGAIGSRAGNSAKLELKLYPKDVPLIPANVEAQIHAGTLFGAKYVDLVIPDDPSPRPLAAGAVLQSRNVTAEVNTVLESVKSVFDAVDPAKLNAVLTAVAESLGGKGEVIGESITASKDVLSAVNPRMPLMQRNFQAFGATADVYSSAADHILTALDSTATTARTVTSHANNLDAILLSAVGFGHKGVDVIGGNAPGLIRSINILEPTTSLLLKYQPTLTCFLTGSKWYLDNAIPVVGGNGRTAVLDAGLAWAVDPYKYPKHLPVVNAKGGPGGRPSCGSLPDVSADLPVRMLVTDTGWGTTPGDIRTNPGLGDPYWVDFLPVTRPVPQPPSYRVPPSHQEGQ